MKAALYYRFGPPEVVELSRTIRVRVGSMRASEKVTLGAVRVHRGPPPFSSSIRPHNALSVPECWSCCPDTGPSLITPLRPDNTAESRCPALCEADRLSPEQRRPVLIGS